MKLILVFEYLDFHKTIVSVGKLSCKTSQKKFFVSIKCAIDYLSLGTISETKITKISGGHFKLMN